MVMLENIAKFFKGLGKNKNDGKSKDAAKERLHLVLMQDRANVSADFLALMKQEIIEVIKKYIDVDENAIDVKLTNKANEDGTTGAPVLYANIPIMSVKEEAKEEARKIKKENETAEANNAASEKQDEQVEEKTEKKNDEAKKKEETVEEAPQTDEEEEPTVDSEQTEEIQEEDEKEDEEPQPEEVIEKAEEIVEELQEETETE